MQTLYLVLSICLIVGLLALFFITFVINRKTPVPKGCENIKIEEESCMACSNSSCEIKEKFEYEKLKEEFKKDGDLK
ncbi:MAG: hypothetical protein IJU60_02225 [Acholeplasmatales bacterium]|nr:hypothetical protein [Acholeplasmatales bacterium]